jgi:hypothetical protein
MLISIDVGIKNLAICIGDKDGIRHWDVINLSNLEEKHDVCTTCGKPAKWKIPDKGLVCGVHVSKKATFICDDKSVSKPTVAQLQTFLTAHNLSPKGKRDELMERASLIATIPVPKKKNMNTFASNTVQVHDAIREWITRDWKHLEDVTRVYIEHQPVYKNPVMKTVQLLLFASLRERYLIEKKSVAFYFVHASKKVKGEKSGDDGYKDRKKGGIERARTFLLAFPEGHVQRKWLTYIESVSKKDDLCDTLCMLLDQLI